MRRVNALLYLQPRSTSVDHFRLWSAPHFPGAAHFHLRCGASSRMSFGPMSPRFAPSGCARCWCRVHEAPVHSITKRKAQSLRHLGVFLLLANLCVTNFALRSCSDHASGFMLLTLSTLPKWSAGALTRHLGGWQTWAWSACCIYSAVHFGGPG